MNLYFVNISWAKIQCNFSHSCKTPVLICEKHLKATLLNNKSDISHFPPTIPIFHNPNNSSSEYFSISILWYPHFSIFYDCKKRLRSRKQNVINICLYSHISFWLWGAYFPHPIYFSINIVLKSLLINNCHVYKWYCQYASSMTRTGAPAHFCPTLVMQTLCFT